MLKPCMLVILLCGCSPADHYMARFSQDQSARNFRAMGWSTAPKQSQKSRYRSTTKPRTPFTATA